MLRVLLYDDKTLIAVENEKENLDLKALSQELKDVVSKDNFEVFKLPCDKLLDIINEIEK